MGVGIRLFVAMLLSGSTVIYYAVLLVNGRPSTLWAMVPVLIAWVLIAWVLIEQCGERLTK